MRPVLVTAAAVAITLALAGCGGKPLSEQAAEKAVKTAIENRLGVRVEDDVSQAPELKDFPVPPGFQPEKDSFGLVETPDGRTVGQEWHGATAVAQVAEFYRSALTSKGFKEAASLTDAERTVLHYVQGEGEVTLNLEKRQGGGTRVSLVLVTKKK